MSEQLIDPKNWPALARREEEHRQQRERFLKHHIGTRASGLRGGWTEADDFGAESIPINKSDDESSKLQITSNRAVDTPHWGLVTEWPSLQETKVLLKTPIKQGSAIVSKKTWDSFPNSSLTHIEFEWERETSEQKWLKTQRNVGKQILDVEPKRYASIPRCALYVVTLNHYSSVESDDSCAYRMWVPEEFPEEMDKPCDCIESEQDIDWSRLLPNRNVVEEVQARSFDCEVNMGPSSRMKIVSYIRENCEKASNGSYKVGTFVRCDVDSTAKDPFRRCKLYLPGIWNNNEELADIRNIISSTFGNNIARKETMEISLLDCNYSVIIKQGGDCELLWNDQSFSALIDVNFTENIDTFCRNTFKGVVSVNRLTRLEQLQCHKILKAPLLFECLVRVTFSSLEQCYDAIKMCKDNKIARPLPRFLLEGNDTWNSTDVSSVSFILKWYRRPSKGRATLILRNPEDVAHCENVLCSKGFGVCYGNKFDITNREMELNCIPEDLHEDYELERYLRNVLILNDIEMETVSIHRYHQKDRCNIVEVINRRLIVSCIDSRVWNRLIPLERHEWASVLSSELPWKIHLDPEQPGSDVQKASVFFIDVAVGLAIANNLLPLTPRPDVFVINSLDKLGVRILPKYRISLPITREVRVACDFIIREWDELERQNSDMYDCCDWVRIVDIVWDNNATTGYIHIEGWPVSRVQEMSARLLSLFRGETIDCLDHVKEGQLLFGYGAKWVEKVRSKFHGRIVLDIDLLSQRITLVGSPNNVRSAKSRILSYVNEKNRLILKTSIVVAPPQYLTTMRDALAFLGNKRLSDLCGGASTTFNAANKSIDFKGTIEQFEKLTNYLNNLDTKLISSSSKTQISSRPDCPVCLNSVPLAYYCLENCGHYYCLQCLIFQMTIQIRNRTLPFLCVEENCGRALLVSDIKRLVLGSSMRLPWLSAQKLRPLIRAVVDYNLQKDKTLQACPTPDCFGVYKAHGEQLTQTVICDVCKRERCSICFLEPHTRYTCEQYAKLRSDATASLAMFLSEHVETVKRCPNKICGTIIEKETGCNHVQCVGCKIHFCWLCDKVSESQADIYAHLVEKHNGIGGGWRIENNVIVEAPAGEQYEAVLAGLQARFNIQVPP